jgi:hypothetical protein
MKESQDMHELMIEYLYGELDDRQAESFRKSLAERPELAAELASLQRTREAVRGLPELEPSSAVTTRLLHEAAKQAEARAKAEEGGFFAWLSGLFRPMVAHPAWATVGALVLVAGTAGVLSMRGQVTREAEVPHSAPAVAPAPAPGAAPTTAPPMSPPPAEPAVQGASNLDEKKQREGRTATQDEMDNLRAADTKPAKKASSSGPKDLFYQEAEKPSSVGKADVPSAETPAPDVARNDASDRKGYRGEDGSADKAPPAKLEQKAKNKPVESRDADDGLAASAEETANEATKTPQKPTTAQRPAGAGGQAAQSPEPSPPPPPPPAAAPQQAESLGGVVSTKEQAPPTQQRAGSKEPSVQALHQQARQRVSSGRCGDALALTREISRRDASYYKRSVAGDRSAVCEEPERSQRRKAAKPSPSERQEQQQPAPADLERK